MELFYTILTEIGKAKIANATVLGEKVNLTKFQVGDGNGQYYNPNELQTALKNKVWESNITSITTDENNPSWVVIFATIPGNVGGFTIREAGVFDSEGNLIAVSKLPETYKPTSDNGSTKDLTIKIILEVSNAEVVNIKVDPTVILASKKDLQVLETKMNTKIDNTKTDLEKKIEKVQTDLGNIELTGNKVTIEDIDNNFVSGTVEGALKELATETKALDTRIGDNKTEVDEKLKEIKQSGSDFKDSVASAITAKGVSTSGTDDKQTFVNNIDSIKTKLPILEGDVGVTEDSGGNVYGVEKVEYREIYYEEPMPVEEWSITTESVIKSIICNKSNDVFAILENAKVLQLDSSGSIQNSFTITEATILDKICIDEYENFYYRSGATKLNKCDKYGSKVWELEVARRIDLIQIDNTNKLVCLFVNGNALISVDFNGEIVSEFSISKSGIVQFVVDSNGNFIFRTNTTLKVFKLSKTGVLLWSGDSSPSGISYSMVIDSKDNIFTGLSANFVRFDKDGNYTAIQGYSSNYNIHSLFIDKRDNIYPSFASRWIAKYKNDTFLPVSLAWVYEHKFGSDSQRLSGSVDAYSNAIYLGFDTKMKKISDNYTLEKVAVLKEREVTE